jgi:hypothetical protein
MHAVEILQEALRALPPDEWVSAALAASAKPGMAYVGKSNKGVPASGLVRIYSIRLEHLRERGQVPTGMEPLLHALRGLPDQCEVAVRPFVSDDATLIASFWDASRLTGCIVGTPGGDNDLDDQVDAVG